MKRIVNEWFKVSYDQHELLLYFCRLNPRLALFVLLPFLVIFCSGVGRISNQWIEIWTYKIDSLGTKIEHFVCAVRLK